ncbi:prepilin-type N-terminal cleavage/methylation domain-containing protein [Haloferula sargassicola]|uniref:Prepilin-type N-terminal cleavage/methylation domain-containing protein n=1 Tax=Haloferula sargassicola TaxID=490096 RepID=A0ABP9UUC9_9BACT
MTSAARRTSDRRRGGFTLLEIIIVLALAMMVIGGALAGLYINRDEGRLNNATVEIEALAKRARTMASLQQRPYALEFLPKQVNLLPYADALIEPDERDAFAEDDPEASSGATESYQIDDDFLLLVRRWATGQWDPVERNDRQVWRFDPQGICEPLGVRFEMENGNWIAILFNPLTAAIAETESDIK